MNGCNRKYQHFGAKIQMIVIPVILAKVLISSVLIPCLLKNLHGHSKIYYLLQQLSIDIYLITIFLPLVVSYQHMKPETGAEIFYSAFKDLSFYASDALSRAVSALGTVFFYTQYAFVLLQSMNYYHMICNPLNFREYSTNANAIKRSLVSLAFCLLLSAPGWVRCWPSYATTIYISNSDMQDNIILNPILKSCSIFEVVETGLLKCIYTLILIIMGVKIKSSINQSNDLRSQNDKSGLFFVVCLMPIFNNVLDLASVVSKTIVILYEGSLGYEGMFTPVSFDSSCETKRDDYLLHIHLPLTASVFLLASFIHCATYLFCFSKLRQGLCKCK